MLLIVYILTYKNGEKNLPAHLFFQLADVWKKDMERKKNQCIRCFFLPFNHWRVKVIASWNTKKGFSVFIPWQISPSLFVRSRREGECLNAKKDTLALPSVPVHHHQAALQCKRQLLPFPRVSMQHWKENTQPSILTVPIKDHSN